MARNDDDWKISGFGIDPFFGSPLAVGQGRRDNLSDLLKPQVGHEVNSLQREMSLPELKLAVTLAESKERISHTREIDIWKPEKDFVSALSQVGTKCILFSWGPPGVDHAERYDLLARIVPGTREWKDLEEHVNKTFCEYRAIGKIGFDDRKTQYSHLSERFFKDLKGRFFDILNEPPSHHRPYKLSELPYKVSEYLPTTQDFHEIEESTSIALKKVLPSLRDKTLEITKQLFTFDLRHVREFLQCIKSDTGQTDHTASKISTFAEEIVVVMGYLNPDAVLAYSKDLTGRRLTSEEHNILAEVGFVVDEAKIRIQGYFLEQFHTVNSGVIDLSGRSDLWYHTPKQSRDFSKVVPAESIEALFLPTFSQAIEYLLSDCLERRISIIDLGCGNGTKGGMFARELETMNPTLYLADANREVIVSARQNAKKYFSGIPRVISFDLSEPCDRPFSKIDGRRIFLFLGQTLGNFDDPRRIMQNISDGLKPGDYLVLEVDLEKDLQTYKECESFFRHYMGVLGFSDGDIDYHARENGGGVEMYFMTNTLAQAKTCSYEKFFPEQTKILLASSARFERGKVVELVEATGLKAKSFYIPKVSEKLIAVFSRN